MHVPTLIHPRAPRRRAVRWRDVTIWTMMRRLHASRISLRHVARFWWWVCVRCMQECFGTIYTETHRRTFRLVPSALLLSPAL